MPEDHREEAGVRDLIDGFADPETRLATAERLVRENRFTIAVVFPVVGAVLLVTSAEGVLPGPLSFNPYLVLLGTLVMRLPLLVGVAPLVDRRAGLALGGLVGYAYLIEGAGIATGRPCGARGSLVELGPMVAGVPLGLPVFFVPLVINAYLLTLLLLGGRTWVRLAAAVGVVLAVDLALDPGAVSLGFWAYDGGGVYYGVPLSNYLGWVLSSTVGVLALHAAFAPSAVRRRLGECEFMLDDFVSFVLLWGCINAIYGNWVPVGVAAGLGVLLVRSDRFDVPLPAWSGRLTGRSDDRRS
jgi:putative membrane protein